MTDEPIANDGAIVPTMRQPSWFAPDDKIEWATGEKPKHGRGELHFRNLTHSEMVQLLMTLDMLQNNRRIATLMNGGDPKQTEPSTVAEEFVRDTERDPLRNNPIVGGMSEAQAESILRELRENGE